jgi:hypothetical protein
MDLLQEILIILKKNDKNEKDIKWCGKKGNHIYYCTWAGLNILFL